MAQLKDLRIEARHWLFPSNLLSLSRFLLTPPGYLSITHHRYFLAILLLIAVTLTDTLDGILARRRNEITELGKILDPLADKCAIFAAIVGLVVSGLIPFWVLYPVIIRDVAILVGSVFLLKRRPVVPMSNLWGKLTTCAVGLVVLVYMLPLPDVVQWVAFGLMLALIVISFAAYARVFVQLLRAPQS